MGSRERVVGEILTILLVPVWRRRFCWGLKVGVRIRGSYMARVKDIYPGIPGGITTYT